LLALCVSTSINAQNMKTFSATVHPDSHCYLSIKNSKAYTKVDATDVKALLDLGLIETKADKLSPIEWYNMKPDKEKIPAALWGSLQTILCFCCN
jgi:hypothetical protein